MNKTKKYTNLNFTKRVDHETGGQTVHNPNEPAVCKKCGAVYENRRWAAKEFVPLHELFEHWKTVASVVCPACKQVEQGVVGGYVSVSGDFFEKHRGEIKNLLKNEEKRALEDNPLSRVINWHEESGGRLTIETTTEHLAQRFGHVLEKAFHGEVKYDFSHENKVARVTWHRN
jgi:hypothetical protein